MVVGGGAAVANAERTRRNPDGLVAHKQKNPQLNMLQERWHLTISKRTHQE